MAFDYETTRSVQSRHIEQGLFHQQEAASQRDLADTARQVGDASAEQEHRQRAIFHEEQRANYERLTRDLQRQMEQAHLLDQRQHQSESRGIKSVDELLTEGRKRKEREREERDRKRGDDDRNR